MEITKLTWRGYTVTFTPSHLVIRTPEGYLRYELPTKTNTTQDAMNTIDEDIKITEFYHSK